MISDSTIELLLELIYAVLANQYTVGYPGKSNGAGGYDIYVANDPGRVWVRIWDGENVTVTKATAVGRTALDPALRVLMRRVNGELIIDLPDPASARQLYGFFTETAGAPLPFTTAVDDPGMVTASSAGGMQVIVHAYPAAGLYTFADNIDLTADEPGSVNQFLWDVNYINLDSSLGWAQSAAQTVPNAKALLAKTARAVSIPAGAIRTYAVSLGYGQTDINQSVFLDLRDTLVPNGKLLSETATAVTLASDAFTATSASYYVITSQTGTTDNLATITITGVPRDIRIQAAAANTITVKHGTGNIFLNGGADFALSGDKTLALFWDGTNLSDEGAGGATAYYQTVQNTGVDQTQRGKLNFIGATVADNSGSNSTDVTISSVGGAVSVLNVNDSSVGNVGGGTDDLITFTVPAGTLASNGDYLHGKMSGSFAGNVNSKTLAVVFGSTSLFSTGALSVVSAADWVIEYWIERVGATSQRCSIAFTSSFGTLMGDATVTDATETLSSALVLKCTGAGTSNNDIVQKSLSVEKYSVSGNASGSGAQIVVQDRKTQNTAGGTFTSGADRTRDLNTIVSNPGSYASVGSNQITLLAGTYDSLIFAAACQVDSHQAWLYNVTDSAIQQTTSGVDMLGTSAYSGHASASNPQTESVIVGRFTIAGTKVFEVRHRCATTQATYGFGVAANFHAEVYTSAAFTRE